MSADSYRAPARWLHWAMAVLIVSMVFVGAAMVGSLAPWQATAVRWHKWLGLLLLVLVLVRLIYRLRNRAPALPADMPGAQRFAARASHLLLYALMFAMPLIGWAMQGAAGLPVVLPGGVVLPALVDADLSRYALLREAHALLAYSLFAVVLLHAGAALYHGFIRRDGVLASMLRGAAPAALVPAAEPERSDDAEAVAKEPATPPVETADPSAKD